MFQRKEREKEEERQKLVALLLKVLSNPKRYEQAGFRDSEGNSGQVGLASGMQVLCNIQKINQCNSPYQQRNKACDHLNKCR